MSNSTVFLRRDFAEQQVNKHGGITPWGAALGVDKGTVSRQINRKAEASGRFIAAVLTKCAVPFPDAFDVVESD